MKALVLAGFLIASCSYAAVSPVVTYSGMCDASAAVALDAEHLAVANDEDNAIRIFRARTGGRPVQTYDFFGDLNMSNDKPESDLEGATWLGDAVFWITSHGRNAQGEYRQNRHMLFATRIQKSGPTFTVAPIGAPYRRLLGDLMSDKRYQPFGLVHGSQLPPKHEGAVNVEGLCATPEGHLLIGFRNPIPNERALMAPLQNPLEVLNGARGQFGDPVLLDLGGRGVRDIVRWRTKYLILGGAHDGGEKTRLYEWDGGPTAPKRLEKLGLGKLNPEAIIIYPGETNSFQVLSDDGTELVNGIPCKKLPNTLLKSFRSVWVQP